MFNVAVINIKGIIKCLFIAILTAILVFAIYPLLKNIRFYDFSAIILNQTIPGIS